MTNRNEGYRNPDFVPEDFNITVFVLQVRFGAHKIIIGTEKYDHVPVLVHQIIHFLKKWKNLKFLYV